MNEPNLPSDDKDLRLAQRIGKLLEDQQFSGESLSGDPFEETLKRFKQRHGSSHTSSASSSEVSERMWRHVEQAMQPSLADSKVHQPHARVFSLSSNVLRLAIAASVAFLIAIGWLLLRQSDSSLLIAEAGSTAYTHSLADGSQITLRPNSQLYSLESDVSAIAFQLEGEALFDVTSNPNRTFIVEAGDARVAVLGTTFMINNWDSTVSVYLAEGRIELTHKTLNQSVILDPGQAGSLTTTTSISVVESANAQEYLDWLEEKIVFSNKRVDAIIAELEAHYGVEIEIPSSRISDTLSGSILLTDITSALEQLSFVMGNGRFVELEANRYRFDSTR